MGYSQWVSITLQNSSGQDIQTANVNLPWGKFYADDNKGRDIPASSVVDQVVPAGDSFTVYSCGREDSPTGTEGSFDVVDASSGAVIRTISWHCPYVGDNTFKLLDSNDAWAVDTSGFSQHGALGQITVAFSQF
uniref:Hemolysin n=1 Tax=Sparassis latifolia TaxID=1202976 RepID=A0A1D8QL06_9APHY|nr:hemolysin [Sparassis latifolia]